MSTISDTRSVGKPTPCLVCSGPTETFFRDVFDDRYGYPELFDLQTCSRCGHKRVPARFTAEELGRLYTTYYPRRKFDIDSFEPAPDLSGFRAWLNGERGSAFRWVPHGVRVLDIGCGIGQTLAYHEKRGCEAVGIEADHNVQAIAARHNLKIVNGIFDGTQFESSYFDYVTLDQVAEHVMDPHALMQGVHRVLKPGGRAIVATPNPDSLGASLYGRRWLNWHIPYHMQFYTRRSMQIVAERAGLILTEVHTITASEWQFYQWCHAAAFPRYGFKSVFWCPDQATTIKRQIIKVADIVGRCIPVHRLISRVLDALGGGDNCVFLLRKP